MNTPSARLARFFNTLFASLSRGARAIFQFYPESDDQVNLIMSVATKAGFTGGLVVDYPNSKKAKKFYLCLMSGQSNSLNGKPPVALGSEEVSVNADAVAYATNREKSRSQRKLNRKKGDVQGDKDWILRKKSLYRQRGKEDVPNDSK